MKVLSGLAARIRALFALPSGSASFVRIGLISGLFLSALLAFAFLNDYLDWGDDWAQYILQAQAIRNHNVSGAIAQNAFMMRESSAPTGPVAYPWGLPLLLAAEGSLFSPDIHVYKLFNVALFLFLVVAIFRLARNLMPEIEALAAALMFAFNPVLLHYCNQVLTEIPFTLISVCAFLAMEKRASRGASRICWQLLTGALAFAAFAFRTNGILVLAAVTMREFLPDSTEKDWRRPPIRSLLLPYLSFGMLYAIWQSVLPSGGASYVEMLKAVSLASIAANARSYPVNLFDFFTGGRHSAFLAVILGPIVILGAWNSRRRSGHLSLYVLLTIALYTVWPANQGYRFMIPITPFWVILMMLGLEVLAHWRSTGKAELRIARLIQFEVPVAFLIVATVAVGTGRLPREKWNPYDQWSSEMFQWIKSRTAGNAVISFFKPRAMHLLGDRLCLTESREDVGKSSYLVFTKFVVWHEGQPTLDDYRRAVSLTKMFENRNFIVYRVEHPLTR